MAGAISRRYDSMQREMELQARKKAEQEKRGLAGHFAGTGSLQSGASIRTEKEAGQRGLDELASAQRDIGLKGAAEQSAIERAGEQRAFEKSEVQAGTEWKTSLDKSLAAMMRKARAEEAQSTADWKLEEEKEAGEFASKLLAKEAEFADIEAGKQSEWDIKIAGQEANIKGKLQAIEERELDVNAMISAFNMKDAELFAHFYKKLYGSSPTALDNISTVSDPDHDREWREHYGEE